jgi:hypothetical protein
MILHIVNFALATVVATSIVAIVVSFGAFMGIGFSLSFLHSLCGFTGFARKVVPVGI